MKINKTRCIAHRVCLYFILTYFSKLVILSKRQRAEGSSHQGCA